MNFGASKFKLALSGFLERYLKYHSQTVMATILFRVVSLIEIN